MKNTINEVKTSLKELNSKCKQGEESANFKIGQLRSSEEQKRKKIKKNEYNPKEQWDTIKCTNIYIMGVPEEEKGQKDFLKK